MSQPYLPFEDTPAVTLNEFVRENRWKLFEKYNEEFAATLEQGGLDNFRDWSNMRDEICTMANEVFGLGPNDCADEHGIFDDVADYWGHLSDEVETLMILDYFQGLERRGDDPYGEA